jgi:S-DNA-T family DNA segregation ATPase FtsK/SpoIIIE
VGSGVLVILLGLPDLRRALARQLINERREARLRYVFWYCNIVGRGGHLPNLTDVKIIPAGRIYHIELPIGLYKESLEKRLPELAVAFNAAAIRIGVSETGARHVEMTVTYGDAFRRSFPSPLLGYKSCSLWDPIVIGVGEDGGTVSMSLFEHNLLIGGEPGSGKSVALSSIVAAGALDPTVHLVLLDGKEVELSLWLDVAGQFVGRSQEDATRVLEEVQAEMDDRYRGMAATRRRKIDRSGNDGLILVVIDELALYLRGGEKALRDRFADLLRDLIARGRAAGVIVVAATQKPSHDIVPTYIRDLFAYRLALRCTSPEASDTILGQGWASQGFSASMIDPQQRGVGYLLAEGGIPRQMLSANIGDDDLERLIDRAIRIRAS